MYEVPTHTHHIWLAHHLPGLIHSYRVPLSKKAKWPNLLFHQIPPSAFTPSPIVHSSPCSNHPSIIAMNPAPSATSQTYTKVSPSQPNTSNPYSVLAAPFILSLRPDQTLFWPRSNGWNQIQPFEPGRTYSGSDPIQWNPFLGFWNPLDHLVSISCYTYQIWMCLWTL